MPGPSCSPRLEQPRSRNGVSVLNRLEGKDCFRHACWDGKPQHQPWRGEPYGGQVSVEFWYRRCGRAWFSPAPLVGGGLALYIYHRRTNESEEGHRQAPLGATGCGWPLPSLSSSGLSQRALLTLLCCCCSLFSVQQGARNGPRSEQLLVALSVAVLCMGATGFLPVSQPVAPDDWASLFTETRMHRCILPASNTHG